MHTAIVYIPPSTILIDAHLVFLEHVLVYWSDEESVTVIPSNLEESSGQVGSEWSVTVGKATYHWRIAAVGKYTQVARSIALNTMHKDIQVRVT